jgi:hypothetical protein
MNRTLAVHPRVHHRRLVGEPQVVVRREDHHLAAPLHADARRLRALEVVEALVDPVGLELVDLRLEVGREHRASRNRGSHQSLL